MRKVIWLFLMVTVVLSFAACNGAGENANANTEENVNTAAEPGKDLAATLADTEKAAYEAWQKKDGKYFETFLTEGFVGVGRSGRGVREGSVKGISENPCEVKSYSTSDPSAVELGEGVALLTMKVTSDVSCDGKSQPSPTWAATVYVKDGEEWKAAYHQTHPAADAKGEYPPASEGAEDKPADDADKAMTDTLMAMDKALWEAWQKKDSKPFEDMLTDNYVGMGDEGRSDRAAYIKEMGENKCEVDVMQLQEPRTAKISDGVALLTYKANLAGACDGTALPKTMWSASIYVKDGEKWKSAYWMGTPGA